MPRTAASYAQPNRRNDTDIAVLQVQHRNLDEKVDDLRESFKELKKEVNESNEKLAELITGYHEDNKKANKEVAERVSALEKWKWMLAGAGILAGAFIPTGIKLLGKLLGI